jgi:hypothetical protein
VSRRSWTKERARLFAHEPLPAAAEIPESPALVGRDLAPVPTRRRRRRVPVVPIAIGAVLGALCLVSLRVEILRLRYAVAEAASEEERLLERERQIRVRVRELRDPARLRALAAERGFTPPERVLRLSMPADVEEER